jgi:hypothetical protein
MSIPEHFSRRASRAVPVAAFPPGSIADGAAPAPPSWAWRRAALLLAVAPAPLALAGAFARAAVARLASPLAVVVLATGMIGQVTHTAVFFLPALAAMTVAALRLCREGA